MPAADVVVATTDRLSRCWRCGARAPAGDQRQFGGGTRALARLVDALAAVTVAVDPAELRNVNTTGRPDGRRDDPLGTLATWPCPRSSR